MRRHKHFKKTSNFRNPLKLAKFENLDFTNNKSKVSLWIKDK